MNSFLLKIFYASLVFSLHTGSVLGQKQATEGGEVKCKERERQALLNFKQGFHDIGGMLSTWKDDGNRDCCEWKGVQCDNETGHVQILDLRGSGDYYLSGEIYPSLVELQHITHLDLSYNDFNSHIPEFIGLFNNLIYLNLSVCDFVGKIPYQLGELPHLQYLDLHWNHFEGVIPYQLGSLSQLQHLDLHGNNLAGTIPYQIGSLSLLESLRLGWNYNLKIYEKNHGDAEWLSNLSRLRILGFEGLLNLNNSDQWLQTIGKLPNLKELRLGSCSLSDVDILPLFDSHLNFSTSLSILDLSNNMLTSSTLQWLFNFSSNLQELYLQNCSLLNNNPILPSPAYFNSFSSLLILDLSHNNLSSLTFSWQFNLSSNLQELRLRECDLSDNNFIHSSPSYLDSYSSLFTLDLSWNKLKSFTIFHCIFNFTSSLYELDISGNLLEGPLPYVFGSIMNSLKELDLSNNSLNGQIPYSSGNIHTLRKLDLSFNNLNGQIPYSIGNIHTLRKLDLSSNNLNGRIPYSIGNIRTLQMLDLSYNNLNGQIPYSIGNIHTLRKLDLSNNNLNGQIPNSIGNICTLQKLDLSTNNLNGQIPYSIGNICTLQKLDLSNNNLSGMIPNLSNFSSLERLYLYNNRLNGELSEIIKFLPHQMESLNLGKNSFKGVLTESHFRNFSKLKGLDLSYNSLLVLRFSKSWTPPFQLTSLGLASCKLGPNFPSWLQTQCNLDFLDISNAGIWGSIPKWFWNASVLQKIGSINISHNNLVGEIPNFPLKFAYSPIIALDSNQFEGVIPSFLSQASALFLSNNKFSDVVHFLWRNNTFESLGILDISNNELTGQLPDCWSHLKSLEFIDLSNNNLTGTVPISMGSLVEMKALVLRNNNLVGLLPSSLKNCTKLAMLDMGKNKLSGPIPPWIGESLQQLVLLSLRANVLNGSIPWHLCYLRQIRVLDLSRNNLSKDIPTCIKNFSAIAQMRNGLSDYASHYYFGNHSGYSSNYDFYLSMTWKSSEQVVKNPEVLFRSIDLSSNNLAGKIPIEFGYLLGLISLNLSRNSLSGEITLEIGNLKSLEVLDLSKNQLSGKIPPRLAQIDTLSVLDLSNNCLYGEIPIGRHFQTFEASSFDGNKNLCGKPLDKTCPEDGASMISHASPLIEDDHDNSYFIKALFMSMGLGFPIGFWGLLAPILIKRSWRHAYIRLLNNLIDNIYVRD